MGQPLALVTCGPGIATILMAVAFRELLHEHHVHCELHSRSGVTACVSPGHFIAVTHYVLGVSNSSVLFPCFKSCWLTWDDGSVL